MTFALEISGGKRQKNPNNNKKKTHQMSSTDKISRVIYSLRK